MEENENDLIVVEDGNKAAVANIAPFLFGTLATTVSRRRFQFPSQYHTTASNVLACDIV